MTSERTTGQARDVTDARVSGAYRDIAGERAPASLNERVLREARAHAGSGYSYWMGWLRPAAWVATVGLCLAIVVELTGTQVPDLERTDLPASLGPPAPDDPRELTHDQSVPELQVPGAELRQQAPARKNEADADAVAEPGLASSPAPLQPGERAEAIGRAAAAPKAADDIGLFNVSDAPILKEAEEMARMREGPGQNVEVSSALRSRAASVDAAVAALPDECDEEARSEVETWIECIQDIERRGGNADDERKELLAAFPDAELP